MNLDDLSAELFSVPLTAFTSRRNLMVKELRASGRVDVARELSALKKPSLPLWAVNQVARRDLVALDRLRTAGHAVLRAQAAAVAGRQNAAQDLRQASAGLQQQCEVAGQVAFAALRGGGHAAGEQALRRIHEILRLVALQGGEPWQRLQRGSVTAEPVAADNILGAAVGAGRGPAAASKAQQADNRRDIEHARRAARADAERARRAAATAQRLHREATEIAAAAQRAAERAKEADQQAARAQASAEQSQRTSQRKRSGS